MSKHEQHKCSPSFNASWCPSVCVCHANLQQRVFKTKRLLLLSILSIRRLSLSLSLTRPIAMLRAVRLAVSVSICQPLKPYKACSQAAGKLYTCGGYGEERASLLCIDTETWECNRPPTSGPAPKSHDSHSLAVHGAGRMSAIPRAWHAAL